MKFTSAVSAALVGFASLSSAITVSYDEGYDQAGRSLNSVTCSDGANGLVSRFPTQGNLPHFPLIGGFQGTGWNSPQCGTCWRLTYNGNSVNILVIDNASGFNIAKGAMDALTNGRAVELGRVDAAYTQVAKSDCGL